VCILSLADTLGTSVDTFPQDQWFHHLEVIRCLLEAWWERPHERVTPLSLVNGNDVMEELKLSPGPQVGKLLEAIREAQAVGQIKTREEALKLARELLDS
jgi:hypothetical protein